MKKIKALKVLMLIFVLLCTFTISKNIAQAAYPRKSTGHHWADKNATIEVFSNVPIYRTSVEDAVATWNAVTDYRTEEPIVPISLTNDITCLNKIIRYSFGSETRTLAITDIWSDEQTGEIDHVIISLNSSKPLQQGSDGLYTEYYDVQTVILHELGHAIGIAHCHEEGEGCHSQTCAINVMRPTLDLNTHLRTLAEYDIASKQLIYYY